MRLLAFSAQLRGLLAVPFLAAALAFPAMAEPNPSTPPDSPSASQAESTPDTAPPDPNSAQGEQNSGDTAPDATGEATPEGTDPSADAAATEEPKQRVLINIDKASQ